MFRVLGRFKGARGPGARAIPQPRAAYRGEFGGLWPWAPGGYVSRIEEQAQAYRTARDPLHTYQAYANYAAQALDHGDEVYGGSPYTYVPTDEETHLSARAEHAYTWTGLVSEPDPQTPQWPALSALVTQAYGSLNDLWQRIAGEQMASNDW